jgi:sugar O-acyltransferase (sialic acid O-acetyltransferase NeuD family)
MREQIIIIGDGGHARMLQDFLEETNKFEIVGITSQTAHRTDFFGYPVLGTDEVLKEYYEKGIKKVVIGIGGFKDNIIRKRIYLMAKSIGFEVETIVHASAVVSKYARLGDGVVIMPNVVINNDVIIGNNCIIANSAIISHESLIEDHVLVSAGVTIGGYTKIGEGSILALGSKIVSGVTIGNCVLVAAGAVVVNDIPDNSIVYGIPAKPKC